MESLQHHEGREAAQRDDGNWRKEYKVSRQHMNL